MFQGWTEWNGCSQSIFYWEKISHKYSCKRNSKRKKNSIFRITRRTMTTHQLILPLLNLCQFPYRLCYSHMEPRIRDVLHYDKPCKDNHSPKIKPQRDITNTFSFTTMMKQNNFHLILLLFCEWLKIRNWGNFRQNFRMK